MRFRSREQCCGSNLNMTDIGLRHKETLTQIVQHIGEMEITPFKADKPLELCFYGLGNCNPSELDLVRVIFKDSAREQQYLFHRTCYQFLLAPLLN